MGAWGRGSFDNDFAADWAYELEVDDDFGTVRSALSSVVDTTGYLESFGGSIAIAAAEVVAAALEHPASTLPEPITTWIAAHGARLTSADVTLALAAVDRVLADDSELRELWSESADARAFLDGAEDLRHRLGSG